MRGVARECFTPCSEKKGQIALREGATVHVLSAADADWWEVESDGVIGYVPASCVEVTEPGDTSFTAIAVFSFPAEGEQEIPVFAGERVLVLEADDRDWYYGTVLPETHDDQRAVLRAGYIPCNFLEREVLGESEKAQRKRAMRHNTARKVRKNPPRPLSKMRLRRGEESKSVREVWSKEELQAMVGEQRIKRKIAEQRSEKRVRSGDVKEMELATRELQMKQKAAALEQQAREMEEALEKISQIALEQSTLQDDALRAQSEQMKAHAAALEAKAEELAQREEVLSEWQAQLQEMESVLVGRLEEAEAQVVACALQAEALDAREAGFERRTAELIAREKMVALREQRARTGVPDSGTIGRQLYA
eukprot:TRINITY_DN8701_c0_g1_i1.p1 TRINITY_DN8701_c0_g1~~TRINITY_DN8701_c0_g1_i1.p1  ORF type:complete len:364 (+),score=116.52 TRINITY_DN8701_c0_g1_i1:181-1272(+)